MAKRVKEDQKKRFVEIVTQAAETAYSAHAQVLYNAVMRATKDDDDAPPDPKKWASLSYDEKDAWYQAAASVAGAVVEECQRLESSFDNELYKLKHGLEEEQYAGLPKPKKRGRK